MKRFVIGIIVVSSFMGTLVAGDATDRFGVGGAGGWGDLMARDNDQRLTNGDLFGSGWLRLGLSQRNELIVSYDSIQLKVRNDASANRMRIRPLTVGLWTSFRPDNRLTPIATISVGGADLRWLDPEGERSQTAFAAQGGLGFEFFPIHWLSVGALGRVHYVVNNSSYHRTEATAYTLGFMANLFLGAEANPTSAKMDPLAIVPTQVDTDGDGVADDLDQCPGTPSGTTVGTNGCPKDTDGDGVFDDEDQCPNTSPGVLINDAGCPVKEYSVTLDIKFATGKFRLSEEFDSQLIKCAKFMSRFPSTNMVIEGHSDSVGSKVKNKALSQKRADAVRSALVQRFNIPAERISAQGFGSESPIATNTTAEGRAINRRVVAKLSTLE